MPTLEQVLVVLDDPIHHGTRGNHVCHEQTPVGALSEAGYAFLIANEGLSALVKE